MKKKNKLGQEEMVGFALIIILVAVILVVFLSMSLKKSRDEVKSYEVSGFIQSFLQYTTNCEIDSEYLSIQKLIAECEKSEDQKCENINQECCRVLATTLEGLLEESWEFGEERLVKGYELNILVDDVALISISNGETGEDFNRKGDSQFLPKGENIYFTVYY